MAEAALLDRDVRRAIDLVVEYTERYPRLTRPSDWALLTRTRPEVADDLIRRAREREATRSWRELRRELSPTSVAAACNLYWLRLMQDRPAEAVDVLQATADLGSPIPDEFLVRSGA